MAIPLCTEATAVWMFFIFGMPEHMTFTPTCFGRDEKPFCELLVMAANTAFKIDGQYPARHAECIPAEKQR